MDATVLAMKLKQCFSGRVDDLTSIAHLALSLAVAAEEAKCGDSACLQRFWKCWTQICTNLVFVWHLYDTAQTLTPISSTFGNMGFLSQVKSWSITKRARQDANHYKQVGSACRFDDMMRVSYLKRSQTYFQTSCHSCAQQRV